MKATLEENFKLAEALGLNGTPSYVIGNEVVVGAVGLDALQADVNTAALRQGDLLTSARQSFAAAMPQLQRGLPLAPASFKHAYKRRGGISRAVESAPAVIRHGSADLRPQRPEPQSARHPRAGDLRPLDARGRREALPRRPPKRTASTSSSASRTTRARSVDWIQEAGAKKAAGIVLNPAGYTTPRSRSSTRSRRSSMPVIECHITNIHARETFRHHSYVSLAAKAVICGFGIEGYALAIDGLAA